MEELAQVRNGLLVPGIQAADLLAWHTNRGLTKSDHDVELAMVSNLEPGVFRLFDVTELYSLRAK